MVDLKNIKPANRAGLKRLALYYGVKVKWYHTNNYIRYLCLNAVSLGYSPIASNFKRDYRTNLVIKITLILNILTIIIVLLGMIKNGPGTGLIILYLISVSHAHHSANKIK